MTVRITSPTNERFKQLVKWRKAPVKARKEGLFLVEGQRAIDGFIASGVAVQEVWWGLDTIPPDSWPNVYLCDRALADRLSLQQTPPGVVAVFRRPPEQGAIASESALVGVGLQDPGNIGTMIRSAAAFGWSQVVLIGGCDVWHPRVLQATVGAVAGVRLVQLPATTNPADLPVPLERLAALVVNGGEPPEVLRDHIEAPWLLVGNEANGLGEAWQASPIRSFTLPLQGAVESLNAAMAATICAYLARPR